MHDCSTLQRHLYGQAPNSLERLMVLVPMRGRGLKSFQLAQRLANFALEVLLFEQKFELEEGLKSSLALEQHWVLQFLLFRN